METELEKIPAQIGTAVLDASDGRIVKSSGELYNENGQCQSIYRILKDTAKCLAGEPMKRIT
eukprot:gene3195-3765_t